MPAQTTVASSFSFSAAPVRRLLLQALAPVIVCLASLTLFLPLRAAAQMNEGETVQDAAVKENNAMKDVVETPGLPRVLLVGDSISIAYTVPVRTLLKGKANVLRIPANGGSSSGPGRLKTWMGDKKWDVIHFNFGIHDAKIKEGKPQNDVAAYEANLRAMVAILKTGGAKLIWATTTPIPSVVKPDTRKFAPLDPYNAAALKVMKENGVAIDDLHAVISPVVEKYQRPFDVHYTKEGSEILAKAVAQSIEKALAEKKP